MRSNVPSFAVLFAVSAGLLNCREPDDHARSSPPDAASDGGSGQRDDDDRHVHPPLHDATDASDGGSDPGDPVPAEYATDVYLNAGCEMNPPDAAVAANHATEALCEHVIGIAARNDDGDFYEIGAPFEWTVENPTILDLVCLNGPSDDFCRPVASHDIFDGGDEIEPSTVVWGCVVNDCPDPRPDDCADLVCRSVTVVSVVNLEGEWSFTDAMTEDSVPLTILQDGRAIEESNGFIKNGSVYGAIVNFESGDYLYEGTVSPDRSSMGGTAIELITLTDAGNWSAIRTGP